MRVDSTGDLERLRDRAGLHEGVRQRAGVEDGRVGTLPLVVAHRVGRVAEQDDGLGVPGVDRVDVVHGADVHLVHVEILGDLDDALVVAVDQCRQVVLGALGRPGRVLGAGRDVVGHVAAVAKRQEVDLGPVADVHAKVVVLREAVAALRGDDHAVRRARARTQAAVC